MNVWTKEVTRRECPKCHQTIYLHYSEGIWNEIKDIKIKSTRDKK